MFKVKNMLLLSVLSLSTVGFAQEQVARVIEPLAQGKVFENAHAKVMRKVLSKGDTIPSHNHEGDDVVFTVLQGSLAITINETEQHALKAGEVLLFNGKNFIQGEALEDSVIMVTLIEE